MPLTLAQIPGWMTILLTVIFLTICLALVLIVLIQRPQGGGLSGAFGSGGGAGQTAFGTKTGDVLTLVTIAIFVLFLGTAIGLNFAVRPPERTNGQPRIVSPEETDDAESSEAGTESAPESDPETGPETGGNAATDLPTAPAGLPGDEPGNDPDDPDGAP